MDILGTLKSIADAVKATIGWKSDTTQRKDEALKKDEDHKNQLRKELAEAKARGDDHAVRLIRSRMRDEAEGNN